MIASFSAPTSDTWRNELGHIPERRMTDETHDNVCHVVFLDLCGQVYVDLYPIRGILLFNGMKKRMEPLGRTEVTNNPSEIDLDFT